MWINGKPAETVSATDRGLQYGDGLFETIAVVDGLPRLWERHIDRLRRGCRRLGFAMPQRGLLWAEAQRLLADMDRGVLKIILTRGQGGRGYAPPPDAGLTRILSTHSVPDYPNKHWTEGIRLRVCRTPVGSSPVLAGLKHLNRLEQVLARAEWDDPEVAEGLMLDSRGRVIEGTLANLFVLRGKRLSTPKLQNSGVAGVMRSEILQIARVAGISVEESHMGLDHLMDADALFMSNSLIGIWPVKTLETRDFAPERIPRAIFVEAVSQGLFPQMADGSPVRLT